MSCPCTSVRLTDTWTYPVRCWVHLERPLIARARAPLACSRRDVTIVAHVRVRIWPIYPLKFIRYAYIVLRRRARTAGPLGTCSWIAVKGPAAAAATVTATTVLKPHARYVRIDPGSRFAGLSKTHVRPTASRRVSVCSTVLVRSRARRQCSACPCRCRVYRVSVRILCPLRVGPNPLPVRILTATNRRPTRPGVRVRFRRGPCDISPRPQTCRAPWGSCRTSYFFCSWVSPNIQTVLNIICYWCV